MTLTDLNPTEFEQFRRWLRDNTGIHLDSGKDYLVVSRLKPVCDVLRIDTVGGLIHAVLSSRGNSLHTQVIDAMVTPETSFFRDAHPFAALRNVVVPKLIQARAGQRKIRVWCAAAASGQEPYSIAILLREYFPETINWDIRILATDISESMLERCRAAEFLQHEVNRGMPTALLLKYFRQNGNRWQLIEPMRAMVNFRQMNLVNPWPLFDQFDLILLRNVMIYFDVSTKRTVLQKMEGVLSPDGYLILGGAETTINLNDRFERVEYLKTGFYRLRETT